MFVASEINLVLFVLVAELYAHLLGVEMMKLFLLYVACFGNIVLDESRYVF